MATPKTLITPPFRVSYPAIFKPKKNDLNGKMEYSVQAVFAKGTDLSKLKEAVKSCIEAKWGADPKKHPKKLRVPFRDQADRMKQDENGKEYLPEPYVEGGIYLNLKSDQRPGLVDGALQPIIDESEFYAGCYAIASLGVFAYDQKGNAGVSFSLRNLQKVKDGDTLSGRTKPEDDFTAIEGATSADDLFT